MKRHYALALSLSLLLNMLLASGSFASIEEVNGVKGFSSLGWNVFHGDPQSVKDRDALKKTIPDLLAKHQYATVDKIAETLRKSKTRYPNGHNALYHFYDVLELSKSESDEVWATRLKNLNEWCSQYPDSKTAPTALVFYWMRFAWKARGVGYSDTVTEQGWKDFAARLAKGREVLDKAKTRNDVCPFLYVNGLVVALGQSWERPEYDKLFNEAVKRFPDCDEYYFKKAHYLQPRWHGGATEWPDFAGKVADKVGGANGDKLYARIAWFIDSLWLYDNMFTEFPNLKWLRIDKGMFALLKEYPNSSEIQNEYLKLAIAAGKNALAKQMLAKIGKNVDVSVWHRKANFFQAIKDLQAK